MEKPILFTGIRPTGELHIGHYFSLIKPIMQHYKDYQVYVMIADLHALTELRTWYGMDYSELRKMIGLNTAHCINTLNHFIPADNLVIFKQSDMKSYHYDLFYKLLMISKNGQIFGNPIFQDVMRSEFNRCIELLKLEPIVKERLKSFSFEYPDIVWNNISPKMAGILEHYLSITGSQVSSDLLNKIIMFLNNKTGVVGFATYPILMAADIILYDPAAVLVGKDQAPHLQIANELVKLLNSTFNLNINPIIPMIIDEQTIKGFDGSKMSKSLGNHLLLRKLLSGSVNGSLEWFMKLKTFPRKKNDPGNPKECMVNETFNWFGDNPNIDKCLSGTIGCVECKTNAHNFTKSIFESYEGNLPVAHDNVLFLGNDIAEERLFNNKNMVNLLELD